MDVKLRVLYSSFQYLLSATPVVKPDALETTKVCVMMLLDIDWLSAACRN